MPLKGTNIFVRLLFKRHVTRVWTRPVPSLASGPSLQQGGSAAGPAGCRFQTDPSETTTGNLEEATAGSGTS